MRKKKKIVCPLCGNIVDEEIYSDKGICDYCGKKIKYKRNDK